MSKVTLTRPEECPHSVHMEILLNQSRPGHSFMFWFQLGPSGEKKLSHLASFHMESDSCWFGAGALKIYVLTVPEVGLCRPLWGTREETLS